MSNFSDMAYDNYLMHYRTKGSKNGYTKDPDYTPVGEKAVAKKVLRDKIDRLAEENKKKQYGQIWKLHEQTYRGERFQGDFAGMPSSDAEQFRAKRVRDANNRYDNRIREIDRLSNQKTRGDYAGMPSSALKAKENANRVSEISRLSKQASGGDYSGMPSSALAAKERNAEIKKLHGQANRGDLAGMPSSAREAKENANRASEISRLRTQRLRGDYAGMPSSALRAKENAETQRREEAKGRYNRLNMQREAEARRKREYDPKMLAENEERRKLLAELRSKQKRPKMNKFRAEEMKAQAESKRLNSAYEKSKREKAASENRDRELLLAENRRRQRIARKEAERANEKARAEKDRTERERTGREWEDIVSLNKSNSALKSTSGYGTPKGWLEERRKLLTGKGFKRITSSGKGRKI
jgi:hypothetical protein